MAAICAIRFYGLKRNGADHLAIAEDADCRFHFSRTKAKSDTQQGLLLDVLAPFAL
jgi:hypothetical protein